MRVADDPAIQTEEPELDSPEAISQTPSALRALGAVLLVFALGAVPLVWPDVRSGHRFYISLVLAVAVVALACLELARRINRVPRR